ncbi:UDP-N-acetyl glucosamine 2-epimerase [Candidatus Roizmanbacteria bacterium]|nr:UDP-N-acetyl glucosamine 2-epimerase [Candidatus Roizmanbacteria bacterium]
MIHIIIGTKAQLVKMGPLMSLLQIRNIPYNFILTGQHRETMRDLRENFEVKDPDAVLYEGNDIKSVSAMFFWIVRILCKVLFGRIEIFQNDQKGIVLVHGDTFSCLVGALLAKVKGHRVGHVESGLRSFNIFHPFPEELTRIFTFYLADIYFCPGEWAMGNLKHHKGEKVNTRYNTLLDSLRLASEDCANTRADILVDKYCVVSIHRFENIFKKCNLERIVEIVEEIATKAKTIFILHPPTEKKLKQLGLFHRLLTNPGIELRPRCDYFSFIKIVRNSQFLVTDGGSNQEEAFYMGKPCLLLRKASERKEGLGANVVISKYDSNVISDFLENYTKCNFNPINVALSPSEIILSHILPWGIQKVE